MAPPLKNALRFKKGVSHRRLISRRLIKNVVSQSEIMHEIDLFHSSVSVGQTQVLLVRLIMVWLIICTTRAHVPQSISVIFSSLGPVHTEPIFW